MVMNYYKSVVEKVELLFFFWVDVNDVFEVGEIELVFFEYFVIVEQGYEKV